MATKLKRRLLSFCLALSVAASLGMSAAAAEPSTEQDYLSLPHVGEIGPEIAPSNTYKNVDLDSELLSATGPDEVSSILKDRYIEKISSMSESELSEKIAAIENSASTRANDNYVVSKTTVILELCTNDGIGLTDIYTAYDTSEQASSLAAEKYNDGGGYQDSYRHFIWNHMMADDMGKYDARTIACNYEWQAVILADVEDVYYDAVQEYILMPGVSAATAVVLAYTDAMEYAVELRDTHIALCAGDFSYFQDVFEDVAVRDLWNNCYGRAYADEYSYSYDTAFSVANANGELINSDSAVSYDNTYNVWDWDWYTP